MTFEGETDTFNPYQSFFIQNYVKQLPWLFESSIPSFKKKILVEKKLCEYLFDLKNSKRLFLSYCIFICKKKCCICVQKLSLEMFEKLKFLELLKAKVFIKNLTLFRE